MPSTLATAASVRAAGCGVGPGVGSEEAVGMADRLGAGGIGRPPGPRSASPLHAAADDGEKLIERLWAPIAERVDQSLAQTRILVSFAPDRDRQTPRPGRSG